MQDNYIDHECPICHKVLRGTTSVNGDFKAQEGAVTVCTNCAGISIFDKELQLHEATKEDMNHILLIDPGAYAVLLATRDYFLQQIKWN